MPASHEPQRDVHTYFGLTYASYLTLPRVLLQEMPADWQDQFIGLLETLNAAYRHVEQPESFHVQTGKWIYVEEANEKVLRRLGWADSLSDWLKENPEPIPEEVDADEHDAWSAAYDEAADAKVWWDPNGDEAGPAAKVFFPTTDPLPPYRYPKGIEPHLGIDEAADARS